MNRTIGTIIVLLIIVIGGRLLYAQMAPGSTAINVPLTTEGTPSTNTATNTAAVPNHDNIYLTSTDPVKGTYLTDYSNVTLYTFDKDSVGTSTCYDGCAITWPPYTSGATSQGSFPAGISVINRADGIAQFAWQGKPLYYYTKDIGPGKLLGDGIGGTWHIVKM